MMWDGDFDLSPFRRLQAAGTDEPGKGRLSTIAQMTKTDEH